MPPSKSISSHRLFPRPSTETSAAPALNAGVAAAHAVGAGEAYRRAAGAGLEIEIGDPEAAQLEVGIHRAEAEVEREVYPR